jgi:hypothetical protein
MWAEEARTEMALFNDKKTMKKQRMSDLIDQPDFPYPKAVS